MRYMICGVAVFEAYIPAPLQRTLRHGPARHPFSSNEDVAESRRQEASFRGPADFGRSAGARQCCACEQAAKISDDEILSVLAKMIKQREESAATYESAGRPELAAAERDEITVIREFMPRQMSADEALSAVKDAIAAAGATGPEGYGQGHGGAERAVCRPDGFRQGERADQRPARAGEIISGIFESKGLAAETQR